MITRTILYSGKNSCEDEISKNKEMFFEADRLDTLAYEILDSGGNDSETWRRFTEAKQRADEQRTAAYQDWMRIRRQSKKK